MALTAGTVFSNIPGVDDPDTESSFLIEIPGVDDAAIVVYIHSTPQDVYGRVINISGTTISSVGAEQTIANRSNLIDNISGC